MNADIIATSTLRPDGVMSKQDALAMAAARAELNPKRTELLERLYSHSTIRQRASVLIDTKAGDSAVEALDRYYPAPQESNGHGPTISQRMQRYECEALPLASAVCKDVLEKADLDALEITQVVTVSCTGLAAPGVDIRLIHELGLRPTVGRTVIGFMGCHGAINGLRVASALANVSQDARVLLCMVELCTLHFQYGWDISRALVNGLFADGAASAVLAPGSLHRDKTPPWRVRGTGSCLLPDSEDDMGWRIGDHGFEMKLSGRVPELIGQHLRAWFETWLAGHGLVIGDIGSWAIHPGGPKVIDSVESALGLSADDTTVSRDVLAECGNMSSPTVLFILESLAQARVQGPCVMLAFGPGLVAEVALLEHGDNA